MSAESAKALHDRQRHYDELHHMMRMEWFFRMEKGRIPKELSNSEIITLKRGSVKCLRLIVEHGMSTNSVDLMDEEYIAELDEFEKKRIDASDKLNPPKIFK